MDPAGGRLRDYVVWYFAAYFPVGILFLKWTALWLAGALSYATWFADFGLTVLTFDFWAITTKLKNQSVRIDGRDLPYEWALLMGCLVVHLVAYLANVGAWLKPAGMLMRLGASALLLISAIGPLLLLGHPPPMAEEPS